MKSSDLTIYHRKLPHWRLDGSTYFVTWRLFGPQPPLKPEEKSFVVDAIRHFDKERYDLLAYVVMDDHLHVVVAPVEEFSVQEIVHSWKSFTANRLQRLFGRSGRIWQREYVDRIIRNEADLMEKVNYILGNPVKRWPEIDGYPWAWCGL
jgi:REP element-mobilizing transposase RayT